jgi:hypothetical protein
MADKINPLADVEINQNLFNLYTILLRYLQKLLIVNHPKIYLLTEVMDQLIILREKKDLDDKELKAQFSIIHSKAYANLTEIYDYDKEEEEKKKCIEQLQLEEIAVSN